MRLNGVFFSLLFLVHKLICTYRRNELVSFNASAATPRLHLEVFDHRTLAKDRSLGEADIDVSSTLLDQPWID